MKIKYHKDFVKHFDKRIKPNANLLKKYQQRYKLFIKDKTYPPLKDHKLTGEMLGGAPRVKPAAPLNTVRCFARRNPAPKAKSLPFIQRAEPVAFWCVGKRSFNITGDIRVVYREIDKNTVEFLDIGTHPQVYGE